MLAFKTIALLGRYNTPSNADSLRQLGKYLIERGCAVIIEMEAAQNAAVSQFTLASYEDIGRQADLAIVLGGDGSMLAAARQLAEHQVPLVGVNHGRLGFMTDIALGAMLESIGKILDGNYSIEARTILQAEVMRDGASTHSALALNDAVVNKGAIGRLIELLVHVDGEFAYDLRSDGLIVATPTGSTAYALSSNGPILQPTVPGFVLVPISPHTLSNRPITVSDRSRIEITLKRGLDARLHFDGQPQCDMIEGDRVVIQRARWTIAFVHPPGYSYYAMLREKLHWSEMY